MESVEVELGLVVREPRGVRRAAGALRHEVHEHGGAAEHGAGDEGEAHDAFRALLELPVTVHHSTAFFRHFVTHKNGMCAKDVCVCTL